MSRFGTPFLFAILTLILVGYNQSHEDRQLMLPLIDLFFPSEANDIQALGRRSIQGAVALTAIATGWAAMGYLRAIVARSHTKSREEDA